MSADLPADAERELRRRNLVLGWLVGGVVLSIAGVAMWCFTVGGLPKDRTVLERLEQHDSMRQGAEGHESADARDARNRR